MASAAGRGAIQNLAIERIRAGDDADEIDLAIDVRDWVAPEKRHRVRGDTLFEVGGKWDQVEQRWAGDADRTVVWYLQPAQYEAARWFSQWFKQHVAEAAGHESPQLVDDKVRVLFAAGGRRGGKTDWAVRMSIAYAVGMRDRKVWLVSPTREETIELKDVVDSIIPEGFYEYEETKKIYHLWNGSRIELRSGFKDEALRRGRVDLWVMNEAQNFSKDAYMRLRAPIADQKGIGLVCGNPPKSPRGQWLLDAHKAAEQGLDSWRLFTFLAQVNPMVDWATLESIKDEPHVTEDDYRRDVLGEFIAIGERVFHTWNSKPGANVKEPPELGDMTREFTQHRLGYAFDYIAVTDFQIYPHMVATIWKVFRGEDGDAYPWIVDAVMVEGGNEDKLIDDVESSYAKRAGWPAYDNKSVAFVGDASGAWQEGKRAKGGYSFSYFEDRGYTIVKPDDQRDSNPPVLDTCRLANALMQSANGTRRLHSAPWNEQINIAIDKWENRHGTPYKRSSYAHVGDTVRYFAWWGFAPSQAPSGFEYEVVEPPRSQRARDLD